jgi:hypothetical protein
MVMKDFNQFLDSTHFKFQSLAQMKFDEYKTRVGLGDTAVDSSKIAQPSKGKPLTREEKNVKKIKVEIADAKKKEAKIVDETLRDLSGDDRAELKKLVNEMEGFLNRKTQHVFTDNEKDIKKYLLESFLIRELGQDNEAVYRYHMESDVQLKAAISILMNKEVYSRLLTPKTKTVSK